MNALLLTACYFLAPGHVSADCVGLRDEAEDYLAKSHQSCADIVYIAFEGTREKVRCHGYEGETLDYMSGADGNLRLVK